MAQLAIKGNKTSGWLVISLLKMMGGKDNIIPCDGTGDFCYFIDGDGIIKYQTIWNKDKAEFKQYTYGEFVENFPYKIGDRVRYFIYDVAAKSSVEETSVVMGMKWHKDTVIYTLDNGDTLTANNLSPVAEQPSVDKAKAPSLEGQDYSEGQCGYKIPEGFEFDKVENGEIILKSKKKELPKTYGECCEVLGFSREGDIVYSGQWIYGSEYLGRNLKALRSFSKLLICRDAYWKLADDWKPGWNGYNGDSGLKYCIFQHGAALILGDTISRGCILMFPTKEMRDTFYENFKDLINECKELL